ncbi:hypothetical protein AcW1_004054 [Taiwanofungus camphoratus]|nr:hypothetical protein AcW1_004054 [Antrodia cinnamomea]
MKATAIDKNVTEAQEMISAVLKQVAATNVSVVAATEKLLVLDEKATSSEREQAKDRKAQTRRDIIHWLSPLPVNVKYESSVRLRYSGTGQWLFENPIFKEWRNSSRSLLWLNGIPGSGKTVLTSAVIEQLKDSFTPLLYYYCDLRDLGSIRPATLFRTLIAQMITGRPRMSHRLLENLSERMKTGLAPPEGIQDLQVLLLDAIGKTEPVIIVIDALDECTSRDELLLPLIDLVSRANVRLLVSSRREHDILEVFEKHEAYSIGLGGQDLQEDMRNYVRYALQTNKRLKAISRDHEDEFISIFLEKADGMFRWVQYQFDRINKSLTPGNAKNILANLPKRLNSVYERILRSIEDGGEESAEIARRTLLWLVSATRPLTLSELREAIAIDTAISTLSNDLLVFNEDVILEICGSLVNYDRESQIVTLSHYSVKEFLLSISKDSPDSLQRFRISLPDAHVELSMLTLTYLLFDDFDCGPCMTPESSGTRLDHHRFFNYAALQWLMHVKEVSEDNDRLLELLDDFLTNPLHRRKFLSAQQYFQYQNSRNSSAQCPFGTVLDYGPLFFPVRYGHFWVVKHMIQKDQRCWMPKFRILVRRSCLRQRIIRSASSSCS